MNKTLSFLFVVVFLGGLLFPAASLASVNCYEADGENVCYKGLVPCGGLRTDSEGNPYDERPIIGRKIPPGYVPISETRMARATPNCQLCHFFVMIDGYLDGLFLMVVPLLAALMIAIGGGMYIVSRGDPEMLGRAKKLFTAVAIGLVIIYGAWIMVNTFLTFIGVKEWTGFFDNPNTLEEEGWWIIECD